MGEVLFQVKGGTPRTLRGINDRVTLDLLLERGPLSRTQVGELTGLSKPTASQLLSRLQDAGLVVTQGIENNGRGPKAQLYAIDPTAGYAAGVDVTSTRVAAAVADVTGCVVGRSVVPTPRRGSVGPEAAVTEAVDAACAEAGIDRNLLRQVAIGTPGAFDPQTQHFRYARHLAGWHTPGLLDRLSDALQVPTEVANDVNLAAIAEQAVGVARGVDDFVLLFAENGLGAAIVIDGRVHAGATGGAGEVGFLPVAGAPLVRDVRRTNSGGFQDVAGGPQVLALARSVGRRARTPEQAMRVALDGAEGAAEFLQTVGARFAVGIAAIVAVVDPALVVLSGSVLTAGGEALLKIIAAELNSIAAAQPRLELAAVNEEPVLTGALHRALELARQDIFDTTSTQDISHTTRRIR